VRPSSSTSRAQGLLAAACFALIVFGIGIRFVHLERKFYTNDEATASLHVAGHTIAEYAAVVFDGRVRTVADLLAFQRADATTTAADVVRSLASEDPQHPPLFYLAERGWTGVAGNGIAARRSLSAVFGALAIAATAWLAWELFGSASAALACATLVSLSPFHVLYAQQTREYSLWTLLLASASALLLSALRHGKPLVWAAYAVALALGLYGDVLVLCTVVAHAAYVLSFARDRRNLVAYGAATLVALASFAPWLVALWRGSRAGTVTNNAFLGAAVPAKAFALKWLFNVGAVFFDLDFRWHVAAVLLLPIVGFAAVAFVALVRSAPRRVWVFVTLSGAMPALALLVPDLVRHESRSTSARYLVPLWLALELAVGWYLARLVASSGVRRSVGVAAATGFACAGVVSCAVASNARTWWGDSSVASLVPIARTIGAAPTALVTYRATWTLRSRPGERWDFAVVELANVVPESVRFRQLPEDAGAGAVIARGTTFVLDPTPGLVRELAARQQPLLPTATTRDADAGTVTALQRETARQRAAAGIVDFEASLWRPSVTT
jgi:uncharacterized membrane protein